MANRPIITEPMSAESMDWMLAEGIATGESLQELLAIQAPPRTYENIEEYMEVELPGSVLQPQRYEIMQAGLDVTGLLKKAAPYVGTALTALGFGAGTAAVVGGAAKLLTGGNGGGGGGGAYGALAGQDFVFKGVAFQGPGIKEPYPYMIRRDWYIQVNNHKLHFFSLINRKMVCIDEETGGVSVWTPQKPIVIGKNPRVSQMLKAMKKLDNLTLNVDKRMAKFRKRTKVTRRK